jgi:cell shape-determining protein MreC
VQTKNKGFFSPALILLVLAVVAIALIVLFVFSQYGPTKTATTEVLSPQDAIVEKLENVGTSDEVSAIEKDVNSTDLTVLDKELNQVEIDSKEL